MKDIHVLCGGQSTEHEISLRSAWQIINQLDKEKYNVSMTFITKDGRFVPLGHFKEKIESPEALMREAFLSKQESIMQFIDFINTLNDPIVIPVIHGTTGEDGQIQGFLRTLGLRFVGNGILSSSVCWDKATTNYLFEAHGIPQARFFVLEKHRYERDIDKNSLVANIIDVCGESVFVKPSGNGSSVGVNRANRETLVDALEEAFLYDNKIVIEAEVSGVELEVSVLGNEQIKASLAGSYETKRAVFDYTAKYQDDQTIRHLPHQLPETQMDQVRELAMDAYQATGCEGFARVDIFMTDQGNFYVNEINTFPGMTLTSLSADLWSQTDGTNYSGLLDQLINLAEEKFAQEVKIKRGI